MIMYAAAQSQDLFSGSVAVYMLFGALLILAMLVHGIYSLIKKRKERGSFGRILWLIFLLLNLVVFWIPVVGWAYLICVIILPWLIAMYKNMRQDDLKQTIDSKQDTTDQSNEPPEVT